MPEDLIQQKILTVSDPSLVVRSDLIDYHRQRQGGSPAMPGRWRAPMPAPGTGSIGKGTVTKTLCAGCGPRKVAWARGDGATDAGLGI